VFFLLFEVCSDGKEDHGLSELVAALHQGAPGQMKAGRSTALALPCLALHICHISSLYLFYFDGETSLAACVLRATTKKGCRLF